MDGKRAATAGLMLAAVILTGSILVYREHMTAKVNPAVYTILLDTIAKGESNGNYNAYFGNADNTNIRFTDMTIDEVLKWQDEHVKQGSVSNAVGKYQIIRPTLLGLIKELDIDTTAKFNAAMQDKMAVALLERRGAEEYAEKKLPREQFAANLAKEWAALPKIIEPNPEQSYYAGDGINNVQISIDEIYTALASVQTK